MNGVRCIAEPRYCFPQLVALHQQIVRIERRYRKNAYARGGQRRDQSSKHPHFRQIKRAVNLHDPPTFRGPPSLRNEGTLCNDGELITGSRNGKELTLRGPLRHNGPRSEAADGERLSKQGKVETSLGHGYGSYSKLLTIPPSTARETPFT
jgi:hypothetical protein